MRELLGCRGSETIYFGDHLSADIVAARQHSHWRTGLVVPELAWSHQTSLSSSTNIFRAGHARTSFASDMETFADIYTGSVCSLVNYQLDHCFSPAPLPLPHEHKQTF